MIGYKANRDIRELAQNEGIYLWQIAYNLGISDSALSRKLRKELPDQDKNKMLRVISSLKKGERLEVLGEGRTIDEYCGSR